MGRGTEKVENRCTIGTHPPPNVSFEKMRLVHCDAYAITEFVSLLFLQTSTSAQRASWSATQMLSASTSLEQPSADAGRATQGMAEAADVICKPLLLIFLPNYDFKAVCTDVNVDGHMLLA